MLKRLELIGFKSFADRTRFDFAPGVTAIVGPNGSGKSNVVDAVRWILGEQSAKALRGGEMIDVIFNGSSTRKSLGMAEVTMTFDNVERRLDLDADEVKVTRRVFRDGEGQYELNGREARLKDVRDLFLGSGAGAYGVIEQGRVDGLLIATPKERRGIFEEAAGVSRFKAKKLEAQRKLERVDADLVRVHDILGELDSQVRSLKLQAAKAERYLDYAGRLKAVRVAVGKAELAELDARIAKESALLAKHRAEVAAVTAASSAGETGLQELDRALATAGEATRAASARVGALRQRLAELLAAAGAEREKAESLAAESARLGAQQAESAARVRALTLGVEGAGAELEFLRQRAKAEQARADTADAALAATAGALVALTRRAAQAREEQFATAAAASRAKSEAEAVKNQAERLAAELARKSQEAKSAEVRRAGLVRLLADLSRTDGELRERAEQARHAAKELRARRTELRGAADALQPELDRRRETRSALRGRGDVLQHLETSLEGVGAGARAVLDRVRAGDAVLAPAVVGLVADLLSAPRAVAGLVDMALGEVAQRIVVRNASDLPAVIAAVGNPAGRVGFVPLSMTVSRENVGGVTLASLVSSRIPGLPAQLLGDVILADQPPADRSPGLRFLERNGNLWDAEGGVTVGPPVAGSGLLSRKSELREVVARVAELDREIGDLESRQAELRREADALDAPVRDADADLAALSGETSSLREQLGGHRQAERQLADTLELLAQESKLLEVEVAKGRERLEQATARAHAAHAHAAKAEAESAAAAVALADGGAARDRAAHDHTTAQVALGRVNEQLAAQKRKREQAQADLLARGEESRHLAAALVSAQARHRAAQLAALRAGMLAATLFAEKDSLETGTRAALRNQIAVAARRARLQDELRRGRADWQERQDAAHARELAARELSGRRAALLARFGEEFSIDLAEAEATPPPPDAVAEMSDIRAKIAKLGSVNPESVAQLKEAEARADELRAQFDDLTEGRAKLTELIEQVNADSRKLFAETIAAVRGHFQELFRKLFGGGVADITLDGPDVLEAGVEVTAHPPGKQAQRLSLLSGGERALVAAALLLAMFRAKPGPFCLLDEIDAAMDDANTERLGARLAEVGEGAQFVVITHKKRMMAHAQVLHGVTMQESGVSKLMAVRFEDWPEDTAAAA